MEIDSPLGLGSTLIFIDPKIGANRHKKPRLEKLNNVVQRASDSQESEYRKTAKVAVLEVEDNNESLGDYDAFFRERSRLPYIK